MKIQPFFLLILLLGIGLHSCKTTKNLPAKSEGNVDESISLIDKYTSNKLQFDQVEFTSSLEYADDGMSIDFEGLFRIKNNEIIWGSLKKFGMEVARLKITPDSIIVLNRFQKIYMAGAMDELKDKAGVPLQFDDVQQLLLGGSFWTENLVQLNDSTLTQTEIIQGDMLEGLHRFDSDSHIKSSKVHSKKDGTILVDYADHRAVNEVILAFQRKIQAQRNGTNVNLALKTQNFELDSDKSFPFDIPSNYKYQPL